MRRLLYVAFAGIVLLNLATVTGCGDGGKAKVPEKTMDVPKSGPVPAGVPGGGTPKGKGAAAD